MSDLEGAYGGGWMGGIPIGAGGANQQDFRNMKAGPVAMLFVKFALTLISTAGAFNLVVDAAQSAAGEGVDDLDLLLNAIFASLILFWDQATQAFNLTPAQLRTILGTLNFRDLLTNLTNGTSVPASNGTPKAFQVTYQIPVELNDLFVDGNLFANGSARLSEGSISYVTGASITPSVVLANGTATVGGLNVDIKTVAGSGSAGMVGSVWTVERLLTLPTVHRVTSDRPILALLDVLPVASNPAAGITIEGYSNWDPTAFGENFDQFRAGAYGGAFELPARCTPYKLPQPRSRVTDLVAQWSRGAPRLEIASGVSSVSLYEINVVGPRDHIVESVATKLGGGGQVGIVPITPHSLPPGMSVPKEIAAYLPRLVSALSAAPSGASRASPAGAGMEAAAAQATRVGVHARGLRRRRG